MTWWSPWPPVSWAWRFGHPATPREPLEAELEELEAELEAEVEAEEAHGNLENWRLKWKLGISLQRSCLGFVFLLLRRISSLHLPAGLALIVQYLPR